MWWRLRVHIDLDAQVRRNEVATVTDLTERLPARMLTYQERLECLIAAEMNLERAELCTKGQEALQAFFMQNYRLFLKVASQK